MARESNIDRLLEEGLSLYGSGDLDGALSAWEQVLAIDPRHAQANSYVEYVRSNYRQLSKGVPEIADESNSAPFPVTEEPEYQIEVSSGGELPPGNAKPAPMAAGSEGWPMDQEDDAQTNAMLAKTVAAPTNDDDDDYELELEHQPEPDAPELELEEATTEFAATEFAAKPPDFQLEESTGSFPSSESTPVGFHKEHTTDVRRRELGFVQPSATPPPADVQVRIRKNEPSVGKPIELGKAPTMEVEAIRLAVEQANVEEPSFMGEAPTKERKLDDPDDLIGSLPRPTPNLPKAKTTQDLPVRPRPPAQSSSRIPKIDPTAVSQAEVVLQNAPTRELDRPMTADSAPPPADPVAVSAPTRELGLRPGRAPTNDDSPTREADVRAFREAHAAREKATAATAREITPVRNPATTDHDEMLSFDPIDARAAQILEEVDHGAPPNESHEDRVRRRIGSLFDRALAWNGLNELDKAVAAVDLALSEDPGSALAQKLIHRNRDTTMMVFQNFLGSLDRQPQLARPLHELAQAPISPRAAFLLSRIDGTLTLDEILDVSGMPRVEAYRHLCQLFLRGILK